MLESVKTQYKEHIFRRGRLHLPVKDANRERPVPELVRSKWNSIQPFDDLPVDFQDDILERKTEILLLEKS
jgi:hypothetical protein